ncbi:multidrug efflux pump [Endobacter medicaginis]|uniref:Efflux RND transporter permease subunit n=1 Tax=Endobacter medicaginis TaxID=1181271 RepID=A0A839UU53_9PROT|nr:efflux RND transporter permease subunit [Endobacter medicaginis]MBB3173327.1 multidrug efflux pump [Endobacter medicaginis]MCX5475712.1 efflux RND transporter permease subunit [Endobacter medicaginis]NVN28824.1 efflux RND transporter permease subunit [Endobacter medicaginis]
MNISAPFIRRPVATTLITIAMLLAGAFAYVRLPVAPLPQVDMPTIEVQAQQPGGTPQEVASSVAAPLERHLGQIAGVTELTSTSQQNVTRITVQFDLSRNINSAANDVEAAIQAARADLPSSLRSNPSYFKFNPAGRPIMILALTSQTRDMPALYDAATNVIQQKLSQVTGVGNAEVGGSALPAVRVEIDPLPLFRYGIGFEDVRAAIANANANSPKGFIDTPDHRYQLDLNDQARKAQDYRDLVIAYRNGNAVRLRDVADVSNSVEDLRNAGFFNGQKSVIVLVFPQPDANIVKTIDQINAELPAIRAAMPGDIAVHVAIDRSVTIRASLHDTELTLFIAVLLVIGVVFVFLRDARATLIPAVAVPTSIIATFGAMWWLGYSLDNLSLMALTIATGFVVDDAIVVMENIARHIENGADRRSAALIGAGEVGFTVLSITLSLVAVFLPILLMGGIVGRLFREFAVTLTITILVSLVVALTVTPCMCALLMRQPEEMRADAGRHPWPTRLAHRAAGMFDAMAAFYTRTLAIALAHPWLTLSTLPLTIALTVILFIQIPKGFFPTQDDGMLMGRAQGEQTISFQNMSKRLVQIQRVLKADPAVQTVVGFTGGRGTNTAQVFVQLVPKGQRPPGDVVIQRIEAKLADLVGVRIFFFMPGDLRAGGRQSNANYQYTLQADDAELLYHWTPILVAALQSRPEMTDVNSDVQQGGQAMQVEIDRDSASRLSITPQLIANTLYDAFGQRSASTIYNTLNQYHVVMEAAPRFWQDPSILAQMWVSTSGGSTSGATSSNTIATTSPSTATSSSASAAASINQSSLKNAINNGLANGRGTSSGAAVSATAETMVPLSAVARLVPVTTPLAVNHDSEFVAATLSFNLPPGGSLSAATRALGETMVALHMPAEIHGEFAGNAKLFQSTVSNEPILIAAALFAIYVVLGVLYESTIHPLTILSTLPSAGVGALLALDIFNTEFSLIAMIGVILLIGIVKKNAIMLVDFAIVAEREDHLTPLEAITRACALRFRPIMMTTFAAALGAVPLVLASGYGAELRRPLGISVIGGLAVSQALTLYTTPVVYLMLDRLRLRLRTPLWHPNRVSGRT